MKVAELFIFGVIVYLLSAVSLARIRRYSLRKAFLDIPNPRSSHQVPTPRGGGLAIVAVVIMGLIFVTFLWEGLWSWKTLGIYFLSSLLIAGVSWVDDVKSLANSWRFAVHSLSAMVFILGLGHWSVISLPFLDRLDLGWLGLLITFLWIVGLTNAYNFMDGIDGIAGGQAVVAGGGWIVLGWLSGQTMLAAAGLLLASASLAFLRYNWPPARIFMGDVGSAFLGFSYAALPVLAAREKPRLALAGVMFLWPFIFDTAFTFLRRLRKGENVFAAHRSHLYQRLVIAGCSHRFVTLVYIGLAASGIPLSLAWILGADWVSAAAIFFLPVLCVILWRFVVHQEHKSLSQVPSSLD